MSQPQDRQKLQPIDWAFLIGGPLAFVLIAYFGLTALIGPPPPPNPIAAIRENRVYPGQSWTDAAEKLGAPTGREDHPDGSFTARYTKTDWSSLARDKNATLFQDEGIVEVGPDARVSSVRLERIPVPDPSETK